MRNNSKGFAPIIIILVLVIIGVVGYFGYKNYWTETQNLKPMMPPISEWKTYIGNSGFTFKYPQGWDLLPNCRFSPASDFGDICFVSADFKTKILSQGDSGAYYGVARGGLFGVRHKTDLLYTREQVCLPEETSTRSCKLITFDGLPAVELTIFGSGSDQIFIFGPKQIQKPVGLFDEIYVIDLHYPENDKNSKALLDQILSTFKFTN